MKLIGPHLSVSKGLHTIQKQMEYLKCETCGIFLKNQRRYDSPDLTQDAIDKFKKEVENPLILLPHGSYLINLANPEKTQKNVDCFVDELKRCHSLGIKLYNLHPGSDVMKIGVEKATKMIGDNINTAMKLVPDVVVLIENMAGQGSVLGKTFEELKMIIDSVTDKERIGITLDTCHLFASGYDIRTHESFEKVMKEFDDKIGLKYLKALHLNDSIHDLGTRKDRHQGIGKGKIGSEAFKYIMNSTYFEEIPMILETPDPDQYIHEIELLKSFIKSS